MKKGNKGTLVVPLDLDDFWHEMRILIRQELGKLLKEEYSRLELPHGLVEKPLYSIQEICKLFDITRPTMYEWIKEGKLQPKKLRGRVFFVAAQIRHLIDQMGSNDDKKAA